MADDSYGTIGLESPVEISGLNGAVAPSLVENGIGGVISGVFNFFTGTSSINLSTTNDFWHVPHASSNANADFNNRVFVMQISSAGAISGQINFQVLKFHQLLSL